MTPVLVNGRQLGVELNGIFTAANTDPIPGGKLWPEAALTWNAMRADYIRAGGHPDDFAPAGPNSSARSRSAQDYFWAHRPPPAAMPYTSNHGWAIAVDVKTRRAAAWLLVHGAKYGWSHDEGARVGEWWHFRYVGVSKPRLRQLRRAGDTLRALTRDERAWVREYDRLLHARRDRPRRAQLRRAMRERRKEIYRAAQRSGWNKRNRRQRYRILLSRTS